MRSIRRTLLTTTVIPVFVGAGFVAVGTAATTPGGTASAAASSAGSAGDGLLPVAKPKPRPVQLAQCNPCNPCASACNPCASACNPCNPCYPCNPCAAACSPCNPCAAACNPCNPCAAGACNPCNPCSPCAAGSAAVSAECFVPRLASASPCNPCNPCAAGACNPCNPCAAANPCNPCNPCAAANPCAGACNPCNPCGGAPAVDITPCEAAAVYACLKGEMKAAYARAGWDSVQGYQGWLNVARTPYRSATHGSRYVNNYVDAQGDYRYARYEDGGMMPQGTTIAKDSFVVRPDGKVAVGPLFVMRKMGPGFSEETGNWRYTMIMPNGKVAGTTGGRNSQAMQFCNDCHMAMQDQDYLFFLPEEFRK